MHMAPVTDATPRHGLTPPPSRLRRRLRKWLWKFWRGTAPLRPRIIPFDGDLEIEVRGIDRLGRRAFLDGYSEREMAFLIDALTEDGMTVFDVGAHIGQFTLMAAKRVGPKGHVHAFEPTSATFAQLTRNIELNGLDHVVANQVAVFEADGELDFTVCEPGKGEFNSLGIPRRPQDQIVGTERVRTVRLDTYCRECKIGTIDLMKIDVEGAELQAVTGARDLLVAAAAPTLLLEFSDATMAGMGSSTRELRLALEQMGFEFAVLDPAGTRLVPLATGSDGDTQLNVIASKTMDQQRERVERAPTPLGLT